MNYEILKASFKDAAAMAHVHVESWLETYRGIVPDSYLKTLSKEKRQQMWESIILQERGHQYTYIAKVDGEVVGFVNGGEAREKEHGHSGELYAIYLLKSHQGKGIGKALFDVFVNALKQASINSMYLWVLRDNTTTSFYKGMGGEKGVDKEDEIGGKILIEDLYYWDNL